ncbi:MAG: GNAT family N-acetyltransferase [Polyangiaceae bacterium]|nr:GNAT family N-acetyltransferase [Polyangiaceae bacterium]
MDDPEITLRAYEPGDEARIVALVNEAFGLRRTAARWRWEFLENPTGRIDIVVAHRGGALVGHVSGVPLTLRRGGRAWTASRVQAVCVRADARRRGLFGALLRRLHDDLIARGAEVLIAFPNDSSLPAFTRSGLYAHPFDVPRLRLPIDRVAPAHPGVSISAAPVFGPPDVELLRRRLDGGALHVLRDEAYLRWRYGRGSDRAYHVARLREGGELVGLVVVKRHPATRTLDLLEICLPDDEALLRAALSAIAARLGGEPIDAFSGWSTPADPIHRSLLALGFRLEERGGTHFVYHCASPGIGPLDAPSLVHLSMGDSDVY